MSAITIRERSPVFLTVNFTDENNNPVTPLTVDWRLDDVSNGQEVLDWQSETPANPLTFTVPAANNTIIDDSRDSELKEVVVRVDNGAQTEAHETIRYTVENIAGVS